MASFEQNYSALLSPLTLSSLARSYLLEDIPAGVDVGGYVVGSEAATANLYMKQSGVFAGKPFFDAVFAELGCSVVWCAETESEGADSQGTADFTRSDGGSFTVHGAATEGRAYAYAGTPIKLATVSGPCDAILRGERTALCILSRCSGVATSARELVTIATAANWRGRVAGTRKTTPGHRLVEKYGLLVGGADTHRLDLSHMVMLKDNHIWACGGVENGGIMGAVKKARSACGFSTKIEVEVGSLEDGMEAARSGADVVMLDNMTCEEIAANSKALKKAFPSVLIEASGGITKDTIASYLGEDVDVVSVGALTQGYGCLDYSLKINRKTA
jgi:nicotinate-nucleotide pyrophosphorylase (carboxylating)